MNDKLTARLLTIAGKLAGVIPGVPDGTGPHGWRKRNQQEECPLGGKKEIESEAGPKIARAGEPRIDVLRRILKEGYEKIDGYQVDAQTANMLVTVYDSLAKRGHDMSKFDRIPLPKLVDFGWSQVRSASTEGLKSRRAMYWGGPDRVYRLTRTEQENGTAVCPKCKKEMAKEPFTKSDKLYTCQSCGFKVPTSKTTTTRVTIDVDKDTGEVDVDVTTAKGRRGKLAAAGVVVYRFPNGFQNEAENTYKWLRHYNLTPSWGHGMSGGQYQYTILLPADEVPALQQMQKHNPARFGNPQEYAVTAALMRRGTRSAVAKELGKN